MRVQATLDFQTGSSDSSSSSGAAPNCIFLNQAQGATLYGKSRAIFLSQLNAWLEDYMNYKGEYK